MLAVMGFGGSFTTMVPGVVKWAVATGAILPVALKIFIIYKEHVWQWEKLSFVFVKLAILYQKPWVATACKTSSLLCFIAGSPGWAAWGAFSAVFQLAKRKEKP